MARSLIYLVRKNTPFVCIADHEEAFVALKQAPLSASVLVLLDFTQPFVVEIDGSDRDLGAILIQNNHPLAYLSHALGPRLRGLSIYEKESMAVLLVVDCWCSYLQGEPFVIRTDQRALAHLDDL